MLRIRATALGALLVPGCFSEDDPPNAGTSAGTGTSAGSSEATTAGPADGGPSTTSPGATGGSTGEATTNPVADSTGGSTGGSTSDATTSSGEDTTGGGPPPAWVAECAANGFTFVPSPPDVDAEWELHYTDALALTDVLLGIGTDDYAPDQAPPVDCAPTCEFVWLFMPGRIFAGSQAFEISANEYGAMPGPSCVADL